MKLTVTRRETLEGILRKRPMYYLDTLLEVSAEEEQIIRKHGWRDHVIVSYYAKELREDITFSVKHLIGTSSFPFLHIEELAEFEQSLIEGARALKSNVGAASGFTDSSPREIEL
jgi:hypothetical protein